MTVSMKRREFLKAAGAAGAGAALLGAAGACAPRPAAPVPYRVGGKARMQLSWQPYELQLAHTFTVASYSRTTTPDVQVEIHYDGFVGYGEASMPPYLGQTVESVCAFLQKVDLSQFADPFQLEDILASPGGACGGWTPPRRPTPPSPSASTRRRSSARRPANARTASISSRSRSAWTTTTR